MMNHDVRTVLKIKTLPQRAKNQLRFFRAAVPLRQPETRIESGQPDEQILGEELRDRARIDFAKAPPLFLRKPVRWLAVWILFMPAPHGPVAPVCGKFFQDTAHHG